MYADDLVLLADTEEKLKVMLRLLAKWCHIWHMQVNEAKCEVMVCPDRPRGPPLRPQISGCLFGTEQGLPRESSFPR